MHSGRTQAAFGVTDIACLREDRHHTEVTVPETGDMDDSEDLPERLQQLDDLLIEIGSDRVMTLSELDG